MNDDMPHKCNVCGETIGFIDLKADVFDERYYKNYEKHSCKEWVTIGDE